MLRKFPFKVWGILASPPCTDFAGSGARWWKDKGDEQLAQSLALVDAVTRIAYVNNPVWWVLENPVGRLKHWLGEPDFRFNPNQFGGYPGGENDNYTKRTCLWGNFIIPETRTIEATDGSRLWAKYGGKSLATKNARSATPMGFANAFFLFSP